MIECFVLAGGLSRRFGEDKLLYKIGDKHTIEWVVDRLKHTCQRLCIVAKDVSKFSFLEEVELIEDLLEKQYALAGLYTSLMNTHSDRALVVSGDMPLIKGQVVRYLWTFSQPPLTLFKIKGKYYPLFAVYYKELLGALEKYIKMGGERLMDFVLKTPHKVIEEKDILSYDPRLLSFINMNTKEDAQLIIKLYESGEAFKD